MRHHEPMPEPEKPDENAPKKFGVTFIVRAELGLKARAVRASNRRKIKLTPWLIEAIKEKCDRELGLEE